MHCAAVPSSVARVLGFKTDCTVQAVYISRINDNGPAAVDGKLAVGDRIISVSVASCADAAAQSFDKF